MDLLNVQQLAIVEEFVNNSPIASSMVQMVVLPLPLLPQQLVQM